MLLSTTTPKKTGNDCKQASLFYKTKQIFSYKYVKNDTDYHKANSLPLTHMCVSELCSTTEQMPALVKGKTATILKFL
jgi:hypothetical protein